MKSLNKIFSDYEKKIKKRTLKKINEISLEEIKKLIIKQNKKDKVESFMRRVTAEINSMLGFKKENYKNNTAQGQIFVSEIIPEISAEIKFKNKTPYLTNFIYKERFEEKEIMFLKDIAVYSKVLTKKEKKELIQKINNLGKKSEENTEETINKAMEYVVAGETEFITLKNDDSSFSKAFENESVIKKIWTIQKAVNDKKQISFFLGVYNPYLNKEKEIKNNFGEYTQTDLKMIKYTNKDTKKNKYTVSPFKIIYNRGSFYLMANEQSSKIKVLYKIYSVNLIYDLKILKNKPALDIPEKLKDTEKIIRENPVLYSGEVEKIVFETDTDHIINVLNSFGNKIIIRKIDNKINNVTVEVSANKNSFKLWALRYGEFVNVNEPAELKEEIRKTFEKSLEIYSKDCTRF